MLKASNKAGLSSTQAIGPVIIDVTPPLYEGGITIDVKNTICLSWGAGSFYDDEDEELITEYYWALGILYFLRNEID